MQAPTSLPTAEQEHETVTPENTGAQAGGKGGKMLGDKIQLALRVRPDQVEAANPGREEHGRQTLMQNDDSAPQGQARPADANMPDFPLKNAKPSLSRKRGLQGGFDEHARQEPEAKSRRLASRRRNDFKIAGDGADDPVASQRADQADSRSGNPDLENMPPEREPGAPLVRSPPGAGHDRRPLADFTTRLNLYQPRSREGR